MEDSMTNVTLHGQVKSLSIKRPRGSDEPVAVMTFEFNPEDGGFGDVAKLGRLIGFFSTLDIQSAQLSFDLPGGKEVATTTWDGAEPLLADH